MTTAFITTATGYALSNRVGALQDEATDLMHKWMNALYDEQIIRGLNRFEAHANVRVLIVKVGAELAQDWSYADAEPSM